MQKHKGCGEVAVHLPAGVAGRRAIARLGGQAGRLPFFFYRAGLQRGMLPAAKWEDINLRLDKYLKVSRLIKRRTVANEACDSGRVLINDKPAKASANVKEGDIITISFGNKEVKVEVLDVQETVKKEEAKELFRYV